MPPKSFSLGPNALARAALMLLPGPPLPFCLGVPNALARATRVLLPGLLRAPYASAWATLSVLLKLP